MLPGEPWAVEGSVPREGSASNPLTPLALCPGSLPSPSPCQFLSFFEAGLKEVVFAWWPSPGCLEDTCPSCSQSPHQEQPSPGGISQDPREHLGRK